MRNIRNALILVGLGASIVVYAHSTFSTKDFSMLIFKRLDTIEKDIKLILINLK